MSTIKLFIYWLYFLLFHELALYNLWHTFTFHLRAVFSNFEVLSKLYLLSSKWEEKNKYLNLTWWKAAGAIFFAKPILVLKGRRSSQISRCLISALSINMVSIDVCVPLKWDHCVYTQDCYRMSSTLRIMLRLIALLSWYTKFLHH